MGIPAKWRLMTRLLGLGLVIRIPSRALLAGVDLPVGRSEEADAVRHAREEQQAGTIGGDLT